MLNILKWDLINYIKRYYWVYIGFAAAFIIAALPDSLAVSAVFDGISAAYNVFFNCFSIVISIAVTIGWLRKNSFQLELSLPAKPWKILMGKLLLSVCIIVSTLLLTKLLGMQTGKFGMYTAYNDFIGSIQYLLFQLTIVITIMFFYITAKSFTFTRNIAGFITVLLFIVFYALVIYFVLSPSTGIINIQGIPTHRDFYITANQSLSWLQTTISIVAPAVLIAIFFFGSCALFKKKFERY